MEPPCDKYLCRGIAQLVERRSPKPNVAGSNPAAPAKFHCVTGTDEANASLGEVSKALWIKGSLRDLHTQCVDSA